MSLVRDEISHQYSIIREGPAYKIYSMIDDDKDDKEEDEEEGEKLSRWQESAQVRSLELFVL